MDPLPTTTSSSMIEEWIVTLSSIVTFFPIFTDETNPWGKEWWVYIWDLSPILVKCPILTGFSSALIVTPYQIVAYWETKTLPTNVELGAIHEF
jgi:hypothetical protein